MPAPAITVAPAIGPSRPSTRPCTSRPGASVIAMPVTSSPLFTANGGDDPGARSGANAAATYVPGATPSTRNAPLSSVVIDATNGPVSWIFAAATTLPSTGSNGRCAGNTTAARSIGSGST